MALAVRGGRACASRTCASLPKRVELDPCSPAPAVPARPRRASASSPPTAPRTAGSTLDRHRAEGDQVVAIVVDRETKLVVQGLTGREGSFHGLRNRGYGTQLVAGRHAGQGWPGRRGRPVFDTVAAPSPRRARTRRWSSSPRASRRTRSTRRSTPASRTVICIPEGLPAHEMLRVYNYIRPRGVTMSGPIARARSRRARRTSASSRFEIFSEDPLG